MRTVETQGHRYRWRILAVLCLSLLVVVIDNTVLNTALPTLGRELAAATAGLQWIVDAYTLAFAALVVLAGALGDRIGRRTALLTGLVLFVAGSVAAALSASTGELIAFRVVMGVGAAFVMPATLSILSAVFPASERPMAIGIWSTMAGGGVVVGPTLGGLLLARFSWPSIFWINVPLVAVALAGVWVVLPRLPGRRGDGRLDLLGAGMLALAMALTVDGIIEAPRRGWAGRHTIVELAVAAVVLAGFVIWELRTRRPLIDVRVFAHRAFSVATGSVALSFFALYGSLFALTQYLQLVKGYGTLTAGLAALPFAVAMMAASPLSSTVAARLGTRWAIALGLTLMSAGLLLIVPIGADTGYGYLAVDLAVMGTGLGLALAPASESTLGVLPPGQAGVGSAVNDTVQELGGTLGVAVIGSLIAGGFRSAIDTSSLPAPIIAQAHGSLGAADAAAASAGPWAGTATRVAHDAFTTAMGAGLGVAAGVCLIGAVLAAGLLPGRDPGRRRPSAVTSIDVGGPEPTGPVRAVAAYSAPSPAIRKETRHDYI